MVANHPEASGRAIQQQDWADSSASTRILTAQVVDLEHIDSGVAEALLSIVRARKTSSAVVVVSIENREGRRVTLVIDSNWLQLAAESLPPDPLLADRVMVSSHAVIAELPDTAGLFAASSEQVRRDQDRRRSE